MSSNKKLALVGMLCMTFIFCSCIIGGGGTDDPSTTTQLTGMIDSKSNTQFAGVKVRLSRVNWNSKVNATTVVDSTLTDGSGRFKFKLNETGAYSLLAENEEGLSALSNSFLAKPDTQIEIHLKLKRRTHIKGRVIAPKGVLIDSTRIFIVGHPEFVRPDSEGIYSIVNVPQGNYSIVFSNDSITDYLPIDFVDKADEEVFVKDVPLREKTVVDSLANDLPPPAGNSSLENLEEIDPVQYSIGQEPVWYKDKQFDEVIYPDSMSVP